MEHILEFCNGYQNFAEQKAWEDLDVVGYLKQEKNDTLTVVLKKKGRCVTAAFYSSSFC